MIYIDFFGKVLQKRHVCSNRNQSACMIVDGAKGVCKNCSRWRSVVSTYPMSKRRDYMYVIQTVYLCKLVIVKTVISLDKA